MYPTRHSLLALALLTFLPSAALAQGGDDDEQLMRVAYSGELLDDADQPITGVFPFQFRLYRSAGAETPVWEETQFVAVTEGVYSVHLGRNVGIPASWAGEERVLEVSLGEAGAIGSQTLLLWAWTPEADAPIPRVRRVRDPELAGRAVSAETATYARDCRTLGGFGPDTLDRYDELASRLGEVRERVERPNATRVATEGQPLTPIGGEGGTPYTRNCPPGFVVTGARGGAGRVIDGFRIICTQLE